MVFQPFFLQSAPVARVSVTTTLSIAGPQPLPVVLVKVSVVEVLVALNV